MLKLSDVSSISSKTFNKSMLGYDPYEVSSFLKAISYEVDKLLKERATLKEMIREKDVSLLNYKDKDKSIQDTLEVAKEMSKKLKSDSQREARLIINDAEQKADIIVKEARDSLNDIYKEINNLRKNKIQIETNLRALLHAHLNLLDEQISDKTVRDLNINDGTSTTSKTTYDKDAGKTSVSPVSST